jgi:hypothetical protein
VDDNHITITYGIGGLGGFACSWNGTDATDGAHSFSANVAYGVGFGEGSGVEATIDSIRYLPSSTNLEFLTQGASVVYDHTDPHIDYTGTWEPLREDGEVASATSQRGSSMTAIFTGQY